MNLTQVGERLFCGDFSDAAQFDGAVICVLESMPTRVCTWIPIVQLDRQGNIIVPLGQLIMVCAAIDDHMAFGRVLVHCAAGIERSPLTVAWWLHTRQRMTLDEAYMLLQIRNSIIKDCRHWIRGVAPYGITQC